MSSTEIPLDDMPSDNKEEINKEKTKDKKDAGIAVSEFSKLGDAALVDALLRKDQDEFIPWGPMVLPSRGLYYGGAIPNGTIDIRPMGIFAEKVLATPRLAQTGRSLDFLFDKCVRFPDGFDQQDLLVGDRVFLLYAIRGVTYGNEYEFIIRCPDENCGMSSTQTYDMNELVETQTTAKKDLGNEPFKIVLPHMTEMAGRDFWVRLRFLRGRDTQQMLNKQKVVRKIDNRARTRKPGATTKSDFDVDQTIEENLNLVIVDVMGVSDPFKINEVVKKMHSRDTGVIREFLRKHSPGIDTMVEITCPECTQVFTIDLPITESFFRPTDNRRDKP